MARRSFYRWTVATAIAVYRRSVYAFTLLASILLLIQLYFFVMPGAWFLHYDQAQVQASFVGDSVQVTLCRSRLIGSVRAEATRTFYRSDSLTGKFTSVGGYTFSPDIENGDRCVYVPIQPARFAHTAGFWKFHTDLTFKANGVEKTTGYDSNVYRIFPRPTNAELQLQLQIKIDDLQRQLDDLKVSAGAGVSPAAFSSTTRTNETTTSSPPPAEAPTPTAPVVATPPSTPQPSTGPVNGLLNPLTNVLRRIL